MYFTDMRCDFVNWINLAPGKIQWRVLVTRYWTYEFRKGLAERLLASQDGVCSVELVMCSLQLPKDIFI
jgi:hypothetical protein